MREVRRFQCEICGKDFGIESLAEECERKHKIPVSVQARWNWNKDILGYPDEVLIRFHGGDRCMYKRVSADLG